MRRFYTVFLVLTILPLAGLGARERGIGLRAKRAPDPFSSGTYRALVIGNDRYRDPRRIWKPLKTAVRDARAVADILRSDYGFGDVRLLLNATRKKTIRALNNLARVSRKNDSVVIYYAGHGYLRKKTREGFWIPVDAEGRDDSTFIPNVVIKSKLGIIADAARHVLLISDSCFSGALLREGNRGVNLEAKTRQYYRNVARRKSVQILAAGGAEFVDDNYKGTGHSPFTYFLLKELEYNENSFLEATDLSQAVARNVAINVQQTPVRGVLQGAGHEGGEFFFLKRGLGKPFAAADPAPPEFPAAQGAARETPARPQAASPFAASAMPMMGMAQGAAGGGMVMSAGGGMLGLIALFEYLKMVEFHNLAVETANSDPNASRQYEEDRNAAATTVLGSALLGAGLLAWAIWGADNGNVAAVEAGHLSAQFGLAPANLGPGFAVRLHW